MPSPIRERMPRRPHLILALVALGTAVISTWPVAAHLRDHLVEGTQWWISPKEDPSWTELRRADVYLTAWILNWELHALVTQPLHLFDANAFYPAPWPLARAEHMFATSLLGAPGALGGPVFAHQTALLLVRALTVWTTGFVVLRWSGSVLGGVVAGVLFALSPFHQSAPYHLQSLGTAYFPLILLALERFAATGAVGWAALGGVALALQILSGQYLGYYALIVWTVTVPIALLGGRSAERAVRRLARDTGWLAAATIGAALIVLPFALPYLRLSAVGELPNNLAAATKIWVVLGSLPSLREYVRGDPFSTARIALPVWILAGLGAAADIRGTRAERVRAAMLILVGIVGALVSLGPKPRGVGLHEVFAAIVPGFRTVRVPFRAVIMPHLAVALLAGLGAAALVRWRPRLGGVLAVALVSSGIVAYSRVPIVLHPVAVGPALPPAYRFLARCGAGDPLLEFPLATPQDNRLDAERMFFSTFHWLPLLNGWTGYPPPLQRDTMAIAARIPDGAAIERLRELTGVRWVLAHCDAGSVSRDAPTLALCGRTLGVPHRSFGDTELYDLGPVAELPRPWPRRRAAAADCQLDGAPGSALSPGRPVRATPH